MNYVVPGLAPKDGERVYQAMKDRLAQRRKVVLSDRRVRSLEYTFDERTYYAVVGEEDPRGRGVVLAIFFDTLRSLYLVCTRDRGVVKNAPITVYKENVRSWMDFDATK